MNNFEAAAKEWMERVIQYSKGKGVSFPDDITNVIRDKMTPVIELLLSKARDLPEESINRYGELEVDTDPVKAMTGRTIKGVEALPNENSEVFIGHKITIEMYLMLRRLKYWVSDAESYFESRLTPKFRTTIILALECPDGIKIINDEVNRKLITYMPRQYKEAAEKLRNKNSFMFSEYFLEHSKPDEQVAVSSLERLQMIALMHEEFVRFLDENKKSLPEVFPEDVFNRFLREATERGGPLKEAIEGGHFFQEGIEKDELLEKVMGPLVEHANSFIDCRLQAIKKILNARLSLR